MLYITPLYDHFAPFVVNRFLLIFVLIRLLRASVLSYFLPFIFVEFRFHVRACYFAFAPRKWSAAVLWLFSAFLWLKGQIISLWLS